MPKQKYVTSGVTAQRQSGWAQHFRDTTRLILQCSQSILDTFQTFSPNNLLYLNRSGKFKMFKNASLLTISGAFLHTAQS